MSELTESLKHSVEFLKERYQSDHPLITGLERTLKDLQAKQDRRSTRASSIGVSTAKD